LTPEVVGPGIVPVRRAVGVAIVGLLFGNAFLQLKGAKVKGRERAIGFGLAGSVAGAALLGVPLILAALAGFAVGAFLIRPAAKTR
jgi:chromate transporter